MVGHRERHTHRQRQERRHREKEVGERHREKEVACLHCQIHTYRHTHTGVEKLEQAELVIIGMLPV